MHQSMYAFRIVDMVIPKHGPVRYIGPCMLLVAPIHGWEFNGIADEEHGQVVENEVLNSILCVELGRKASNIAYRIT